MTRKNLLAAAVSMALAPTAVWAHTDADSDAQDRPGHHSELERITVRALPLARTRLESAQPVDVLAGEELDDKRGATLGETLQTELGIHSTYFGPGAGRPVIRGHSGHRVRVLEDGVGTADASAQSDDHAVASEPLLVDQIEILRGPAALLYGSGAIGGVVNIIDNAIPESIPEESFSGRFEARGNTVADERAGVLRLDGGAGNIAWHVSGAWRDADDYDIPGVAVIDDDDDHDHDHDHDDHDDDHHGGDDGTLENSFTKSTAGTVGLSWVGSRGFLGASFRAFDTEYGIPAPHAHEDDHDDGHGHDHDHDHDHDDDEHNDIFIDLKQRSWDVKGGLDNPLTGFERATLRLRYNEYKHIEFDDDHPETVFENQAFQSRLELVTSPLAGWESAIGLQYDDEDYKAEGDEAFVPDGNTRAAALFVLSERTFGDFTLSLGGRAEHTRIKIKDHHDDHDDHDHHHDHDHGHDHDHHDDIDKRSFTNWSAAVGGVYRFTPDWSASLNLGRAQRAPSQTELFAHGAHLTTFSFEVGDPTLGTETTTSVDLGLDGEWGPLHLHVNAFYNSVDDYVFLRDTGHTDHGLPVREYTQSDARFYGFEAEGVLELHESDFGGYDIRVFYDQVRGKLKGGDNLPLLSPARFGVGLDWHLGGLRAGIEGYRVFKQDKVAEFETATPGYTMVNARLAYGFDLGGAHLEAFVRGNNLTDKQARVHTSHLKNFAPLPGRNFTFGIRGFF